jgi:S1-C subfamily serine protease
MTPTRSRLLQGLPLLLILLVGTTAQSQNDKALSGKEVYQKALKASVWVRPVKGDLGGYSSSTSGSGSVIDAKQNLVLTNYHVIEDHEKPGTVNPNAVIFFPAFDEKKRLISERDFYTKLFSARGGFFGKVIAHNQKADLAIIRLERMPPGTPALRMAKASPDVGENVHSIGSPGVSGALFAYTPGSVKAVYNHKWRAMRGPNDPDPLQLDARIIETNSGTNRGDSGGPLLNDKGELIGVTQGGNIGSGDRAISYFIDITEVKSLLVARKIKLSGVPAATTASTATPKDSTGSTPSADEMAKREKLAASKLDFAKAYIRDDKKERATEKLDEIIKGYPETAAAKEARELIATLKKK